MLDQSPNLILHPQALPREGPHTTGDPWRDFRVWSIGLYRGPSPDSLEPWGKQPIITAEQVTDARAAYVADPFMIRRLGRWYLFFEILRAHDRRGVIGCSSSADGLRWDYLGVVLEAPFHLSFPCVFEDDEEVYLVPESVESGAVTLYRAVEFPGRFQPCGEILSGQWADPSVFRYDGRWWLIACKTAFGNSELHLFGADRLHGPWLPHSSNPVVNDARAMARPAGRVVEYRGGLLRLAQDCSRRYGVRVNAARIERLNSREYREQPCAGNPLLSADEATWTSGMHHADLHRLADGSWLACVDGDNYCVPEALLARYSRV